MKVAEEDSYVGERMLLENCCLATDGPGLHRLELVHDEKAARHLPLRLLSLPYFLAVGYGCVADVFVKQTAEGSQTLKAHFETDVSDAQFVVDQQLLRLLDAAFDQILVRRLVEGLAKEPQEVITREASLFGDLFETERMVITMVDEVACPAETPERLEGGHGSFDFLGPYGFGGEGF